MSNFEIVWGIDDGYCGGSRPQRFDVDENVILSDVMSEGELRDLYRREVDEEFHVNSGICAYGSNEDDFVTWAQECIEKWWEEEEWEEEEEDD